MKKNSGFIFRLFPVLLIFTTAWISLSALIWLQMDPWKENITGLGWKDGKLILMGLWSLLSCSQGAALSILFFELAKDRLRKILGALCWGLLLGGCLIPWSETGTLDLHSLLCSAGILLWFGVWFSIWIAPGASRHEKKTAGSLLSVMAVCTGFFGFSGGVSLVSEMLFVLASCLILLRSSCLFQIEK